MTKRTPRLLVLGAAVTTAISLAGCGSQAATPAATTPVSHPAATQAPTTTTPAGPTNTTMANGLKIEDEAVGTGPAAKKGDYVTVNYTGTLTNGQQFDSSVGKQPFSFTLGQGDVIPGWDQGVVGMAVGGKRKLTVPSELGYGARGAGNAIPPNSTLVFEIEMLKIN